MKQYPEEMIQARTKKWFNVYLPELLKDLPKRHRQAISVKDLEKSEYPLKSKYLRGPIRTGKTVKAWKLTLQWHKDQFARMLSKDFIFTNTTELLAEFRNSYNTPDQNETQILKKYKKVKLLVLDDFATEKTSEWANQMLYMVLNYRYENEKTTIYTSNFSLDELSKRLGDDRLTSRIGHECDIIKFTNKPYI